MKKYILSLLILFSVSSAFASSVTTSIQVDPAYIDVTGDTTYFFVFDMVGDGQYVYANTLPDTLEVGSFGGGPLMYEIIANDSATVCGSGTRTQCENDSPYPVTYIYARNDEFDTGGNSLGNFEMSPNSIQLTPFSTFTNYGENDFIADPSNLYDIGDNTNTVVAVWSSLDGYTSPLIYNGGTFPIYFNSTDFNNPPQVSTMRALVLDVDEFNQVCLNLPYTLCSLFANNSRESNYFSIVADSIVVPTTTLNGMEQLIANSTSSFMATTGFTPAQGVSSIGNFLIKPIIGGGLMLLLSLLPWIITLILLSAFVYFCFRAFVFFNEAERNRNKHNSVSAKRFVKDVRKWDKFMKQTGSTKEEINKFNAEKVKLFKNKEY